MHSGSVSSHEPQSSGQEHWLQIQTSWVEPQLHHLVAMTPYFPTSRIFSFLICEVVITIPTAGLGLVEHTEHCQAHSPITYWESRQETDRRVTQRMSHLRFGQKTHLER